MNKVLRGFVLIFLSVCLFSCGGGQAIFPDYDTNDPNFDQPVQATPAQKLIWTVAPTLKPENVAPVLSYGRGECIATSGVKFVQNGLCGLLDYAGNAVIEAAYSDIVVYGESYIGLHTGEEPEAGDAFDMFHFRPTESLPLSEKEIPVRSVWSATSFCAVHIDQEGYVFPDRGEGVFFAEQGEVYTDANGQTEVRGNGKFALISQGKPITSFDYEAGGYMANGLIAAKKDGKWGYVDKTGKTVIPFLFDGREEGAPYHASNGFVAVKKDGLFGYYRTDGEEVIPCVLEDALPVNGGGLAYAKTGGKWGVLRVAVSSMGKTEGYVFPDLSPAREMKRVSLDSGLLNMRRTCDAYGLIVGTLENEAEVAVFSEGIRVSAADGYDWLFCGAKQKDGKWLFGYCYGQFLREKDAVNDTDNP